MEYEDELLLQANYLLVLYLKGRQLVEKNRRKHRFWVRRIFNERKRQGLYHMLFEELRLFDRVLFSFFSSQQTLHMSTVTRKALDIDIHFDRSIAKLCFHMITGKCFNMITVDRAGSLAINSDRERLYGNEPLNGRLRLICGLWVCVGEVDTSCWHMRARSVCQYCGLRCARVSLLFCGLS